MRIRSAEVIAGAKAENRAVLIAYLPVGFPTFELSLAAAKALIAAGVEIIEFGIPYTDPVMDGELIQTAAKIALDNHTVPKDVCKAVSELKSLNAAFLTMSYFNPLLKWGIDSFAKEFSAAGGAGVITPDLTPDAYPTWHDALDQNGLDKVFLVAPSSTRQRLEYVAKSSSGFVYAASTMGVTGLRTNVSAAARELVFKTRQAGAENVCVGLGVSTPNQAREVASYADGVIVGSAFVKEILSAASPSEGINQAAQLAAKMRESINTARS